MSIGQKGNKIEITIKDNVIRMSQETMDNVYQSFCTTKPTGQGTDYGMSTSYNVVTKDHSSELEVESKIDNGSIFKIILPIK